MPSIWSATRSTVSRQRPVERWWSAVGPPSPGTAWHDFSVTILLQASAGAGFEFVPHLRSDDGEDLEGMRRAQTGTHPALVRPPATPGTLSLFEGRYHYHRATRVRGGRERLLALLQYGARLEDPDEPSVRALNRLFYGRPD